MENLQQKYFVHHTKHTGKELLYEYKAKPDILIIYLSCGWNIVIEIKIGVFVET